MLKVMNHLRAVIVLTAVLGLTANATATAEPMSASKSAGMQRLSLDTAPGERIDVAIWYPTATIARE